MHEFLQLVYEITDGAISIYGEPLIKNMCAYIPKLYIDGDYFAALADTPARIDFEYGVVYDFARMTGDKLSLDFAVHGLNREIGRDTNISYRKPARAIRQLCAQRDAAGQPYDPPFCLRHYLCDLQVASLREREGSTGGFYLTAKGGHNGENHNHNDVGSFILFYDGKPVLVDAGVENYNMKSFSSERYSVWNVRSDWHNLPAVNGFLQEPGEQHRAEGTAFIPGDGSDRFTLELSDAYPKTAGLARLDREFKLVRGDTPHVMLSDEYQFHMENNEIVYYFLTPREPAVRGNRLLIGNVSMKFPAGAAYESERLVLKDSRMRHSWGEALYRFKLSFTVEAKQARYKFLFISQNNGLDIKE